MSGLATVLSTLDLSVEMMSLNVKLVPPEDGTSGVLVTRSGSAAISLVDAEAELSLNEAAILSKEVDMVLKVTAMSLIDFDMPFIEAVNSSNEVEIPTIEVANALIEPSMRSKGVPLSRGVSIWSDRAGSARIVSCLVEKERL